MGNKSIPNRLIKIRSMISHLFKYTVYLGEYLRERFRDPHLSSQKQTLYLNKCEIIDLILICLKYATHKTVQFFQSLIYAHLQQCLIISNFLMQNSTLKILQKFSYKINSFSLKKKKFKVLNIINNNIILLFLKLK